MFSIGKSGGLPTQGNTNLKRYSVNGKLCVLRKLDVREQRLGLWKSFPTQIPLYARRCFNVHSLESTTEPPTENARSIPIEIDGNGITRLKYQKGGYETWQWKGHKINYVASGLSNSEAIVLVHGFGASVYHWRYNIPELSKNFKVYAIDLLGFGWSEKALVDYNVELWENQISDFITDIVGQPAVLAGNSVGGFSVLAAASFHPQLVKGLILLNAAGRFEESSSKAKVEMAEPSEGNEFEETVKTKGAENSLLVTDTPGSIGTTPGSLKSVLIDIVVEPIKKAAQRMILFLTFLQAKQPIRIRQVLNSVYPDNTNVDDVLVESIVVPSQDPNAAEVYYRLTSQVLLSGKSLTLNKLLENVKAPILLLWGDLDPWMTPAKADLFLSICPTATKVGILAGHCPHDEKPQAVNEEILKWVSKL